jgi:GNAT superfamily N-acetyltransferase
MAGEADVTLRIAPPADDADRAWLAGLWREAWGGETMVSRGTVHQLAALTALIAWAGEERVGAATYHIDGAACELTSLNAVEPWRGAGTALVAAVEAAAARAGCGRVWLITTNDNLDALRFYQRRDYRLAAVHAGAIDAARRRKPTIPETGFYGIPIHDELELQKRLPDPAARAVAASEHRRDGG